MYNHKTQGARKESEEEHKSMHNAFYVFTLQTERSETQNETKPLSRVYVVGTYDLFRKKKKGQNQMLGGSKR